MASEFAQNRLRQDYLCLKMDPLPGIEAEPVPSNILEWHYVMKGPKQSPFEGGYYHGKIIFPIDFPFKPPSIYMMTPNGRFATNRRLCLSISDFHPDTWNPAWTASSILIGLLSFMLEDAGGMGSINMPDEKKRSLAYMSIVFNLKDIQFCELFPEIKKEMEEILEHRKTIETK